MAKLTEAIIAKLAYDPNGLDTQLVWDDEMPGLAVRLYASGKKSYCVGYRVGRGRGCASRRQTLDHVCRMSLKDAREMASKIVHNGRQGIDYVAQLTRKESVTRVSDLCLLYMAAHQKEKAASTLYANQRMIDRDILPFMGRKPLEDVTSADITRLTRKIGARGEVMANRTRAFLSAMFNWGEKEGMLPKGSNPAEGVDAFKESSRKVLVSDAQLRCLNAALDEAPAMVAAAVRVLLFSTGRPGEVLPLRWMPDPAGKEPHVEMESKRIFLPAAKSGVGIIPLNSAALRILMTLPKKHPYVFSEGGENPHVRVKEHWHAIRAKAGLPGLHLHDLRHLGLTFSTMVGANPFVAKELARHANVQTTQIYVNPSSAQAAALSEEIGQHMENVLAGGTDDMVGREN